MSRHTNAAYVRKTDTVRREPGGLERAVLMLVVDGFDTSFTIANILETSTDNVNGALGRLHARLCVNRGPFEVPVQWFPTETGRKRVRDEELWA
jgi:hypothetical protein